MGRKGDNDGKGGGDGNKGTVPFNGEEGMGKVVQIPVQTNEQLALVVREMNERHALCMLGGQALVMSKDPHGELVFSTPQDMRVFYANRAPIYIEGQAKPLSWVDAWLRDPTRRTYEGLTFDPSRLREKEDRLYNLWEGWAIEPKKGDWSLFQEHVWNILAKQEEASYYYIIRWLAHLVQYPAIKPGVALVLRGEEGTGKGTFAHWVGKLAGRHARYLSQSRHLTGTFNSLFKDALIVFADEAFWGGDKQHEGPLKSLITEPMVRVEHKGKDSIEVPSYTRFVLATNNDWAVPAGKAARRYMVLDVSDERRTDIPYFEAINEQMANGGLAAMLYDLTQLEISGTIIQDVPKTNGLLDQKIRSLPPVGQWWYHCLSVEAIENPDNKGYQTPWDKPMLQHKTWLYDSYLLHASKMRTSHPENIRPFFKFLYAMCPSLKNSAERLRLRSGERVRALTVPQIETAQEEFCLYLGQRIDFG